MIQSILYFTHNIQIYVDNIYIYKCMIKVILFTQRRHPRPWRCTQLCECQLETKLHYHSTHLTTSSLFSSSIHNESITSPYYISTVIQSCWECSSRSHHPNIAQKSSSIATHKTHTYRATAYNKWMSRSMRLAEHFTSSICPCVWTASLVCRIPRTCPHPRGPARSLGLQRCSSSHGPLSSWRTPEHTTTRSGH